MDVQIQLTNMSRVIPTVLENSGRCKNLTKICGGEKNGTTKLQKKSYKLETFSYLTDGVGIN